MRGNRLWFVPLAVIGFTLFAVLGGWVVMTLWNWLLPPLFGWHELRLPQALALLVLCRILFGGFGMHGGPRSAVAERVRGRVHERMGERLEERMAEHFDRMTPEERERFRRRMQDKFGFGQPGTTGPGAGTQV